MAHKKPNIHEAPIEPQDVAAQEIAKQQLADLIAAADPGLENSGNVSQNFSGGVIPANEVLMPTEQSAIVAANLANPDLAKLAPSYVNTLSALEAALGEKEGTMTLPTLVGIGKNTVQMPAQARDIANKLYRDRKGKLIPAPFKTPIAQSNRKADKFLMGLFGLELGTAISQAAATKGFAQTQLVWVAQQLWYHLSMDMPHEFKADSQFNAELDKNPTSVVITICSQIFDFMTVKSLSRLAEFHNISVIDVLRCVFRDIVTSLGIEISKPVGE